MFFFCRKTLHPPLHLPHPNPPEFVAERAVVGQGLLDQAPEFPGMVELAQMTEFVHDNIVRQFFRQESDFVVEVEIPFFRTASPPGFLILHCYLPKSEAVVGVLGRNFLCDELKRVGFGGKVLGRFSF